jgi:hypothetical protein
MRQCNKHFARNFANEPVDPQTARTAKMSDRRGHAALIGNEWRQ